MNPQSPSFITSIAPRLSLELLCEPLLLVYYSLVCVSPLCAAFANLRRACLCEPTMRRQRVLVVVSHWIPPSFLLLQFYDSLVCVSPLCTAFASLQLACLCELTMRRQRGLEVESHWVPPFFKIYEICPRTVVPDSTEHSDCRIMAIYPQENIGSREEGS